LFAALADQCKKCFEPKQAGQVGPQKIGISAGQSVLNINYSLS